MDYTISGARWRPILIVIAALALVACGSSLTAEERLTRAEQSLAGGNAASAAIHLRNVLQEDPTNIPARIMLAEAAGQSGDFDTAAKEFQRAVDLGGDVDTFRVPFAEALVRIGAMDRALQVTDVATADSTPTLRYWRALALLGTGDVAQARQDLEALADDPDNAMRAQVGLARIKLVEGEPSAALAMLEPLAQEASGFSDYWQVRALSSALAGDHEQAAKAFSMAAATVLDSMGLQRLRYQAGEIESLLALGRLEQAREKATALYNLADKHPLTNYLMARVELQSGNPQQALAHGQAMLASQPNASVAHMLVGAAHLALEQASQAERHLERAVSEDPANVNARRLLAQLRLGLQSPDGALEALGPMTAGTVDPGLAQLAGVASVRAGDAESAVSIFRRQVEQDPSDDQARSLLAVSLMAAGRIEEALAELAQVSGADAAVRQRADLIEVSAHLQAGSMPAARATASTLANERPTDASLRSVLGGLFLSAGHADDARSWFEDSLRIEPGNIAAQFNLGRIEAATGNLRAARSQFMGVVEADANNSAALAAVAQLDWFAGERDRALQFLEQARAANPRDSASRILLANYLRETGRPSEAASVASEAVAIAPESAAAHDALGRARLAADAREALASFREAHRLEPGAPSYLVNVARAELALGEVDAGRASLVNALALDPEYLPALSALVELERRRGRVDAARQYFTRLERAAPAGSPAVEQTRGELLLAEGEAGAAERAFQLALEGGAGRRAVAGIHDARRRGSGGDPAEPLLDWLRGQPDDSVIRALLADYRLMQADHVAAIEEYERLVAAAPENALYLNNLAWLYDDAQDPRAIELAERAHRVAPDNPMIADTLGWIKYKQGDVDGALALIRAAAAAAPQVGEIQYHLAVLLAETGDADGARAAARRVLAEAGAANYHEAAQKLLDRLAQE